MSSSELCDWLLQATLASTAAIVLVLLLRKPMRAMFGPGVGYALWWLVPASLLAVMLPVPQHGSGWVPAAGVAAMPGRAMESLQAVASALPETTSAWTDPARLALVVWLIGVLSALLYMVMQQRRFLHALGPLNRRADGLFQSDAQLAGLPAVFGLWRARIVVPADFDARFDADERVLMRAHENAHVAAGDLQANAFAVVLRCVFWFNPLLHWAIGRFRHDQEIACDARVLHLFPQARRQYGQAMLKAQLAPATLPLACNWGLIHPFKERVQMLRTPAPGALRWLTGLALVGTLTLGVGMAAWSAQPQAATPAPATATASAQPALGKVTVRLENATYAEAVRQVAEVIDAEVTGLEAFDGSDRRINFSFVDSDAKMVFSLIAEEAGVNVVFGGKKVVFSKS
ncbi:MAG: energy transducer TonB [Pseudoxanthomonas suwonensis]|nr:MAG: energy transducer TonB [Pseudoxanthomonas suwonensis]